MSGKNNFVFVVCGADEHIRTLNIAIKQLQRFSTNNIIIVTDKKRNHIGIEHDNIIDISTPGHFDHHQASIYLKTGLHKYIDLSTDNCYLDSDVIALSPKVDEIFLHAQGPVTFAADHCKMDSFSPYATNCECHVKKNNDQKAFVKTVQDILPEYEHDTFFHNKEGRELCRILSDIKENPLKRIDMIFDYFLARYFLNKHSITKKGRVFRYSRGKKGWVDIDGKLIMYNLTAISGKIKTNSEFSYSRWKRMWVDKNGEDLFSLKCDHLAEKIRQKFGVHITQKDFQHWNGGVFLFNKNSVDFLETWHQFTMEIFKDKSWKTRDQGTLIATVWKFNLQHQALLPQEFNFIADYNNPGITYEKTKGFTINNFKTIIRPNFIHVYHQFGNKGWDIWQGIEDILDSERKE